MKLATFEVDTAGGRHRRLGVVTGSSVIDVTAGYATILADDGVPRPTERAEAIVPSEMTAFLRTGEDAFEAARTVLETEFWGEDARSPSGARIVYDNHSIRLLSPLPRPNSIRDCSVFEDHADFDEKPDVWYDYPLYYKGNPDSVVSPDTDVAWPSWEDRLDFELEVAAVIGQQGRNVDAENADEYIAGYTIFNDFSARDTQFAEMKMPLGPSKGKDFANGFGPYLVTRDAFDATGATVRATINCEEWMTGSLSDMYHSWGEMVAYASKSETIHPGDVIGCGTIPSGCCMDLDRWIEPGDTIELHVDGIGTLTHRVVAETEMDD